MAEKDRDRPEDYERPNRERPEDQDQPDQDQPEVPDPGQFHERDREKYTPFIVLRYAAGDGGPRPIPGGTVFWHSPDVWVMSSAGYNQPVAGEVNKVFARVNNLGLQDAAGVIVRYWWANPSLAITETSAHLIGTASPFVPAGNSVVVECPTPWVPVIENGGHECILAEAWVPYFDPIVAPLEPVTDRHVCQKNLHVIEVTAGMSFTFPIEVANISDIIQRVTLQVRAPSFREIQAALTAPDIGYKDRLVETQQQLPLQLELSQTGAFIMKANTVYPTRLLAAARLAAAETRGDLRPPGTVTQTTTFEAWETRRLVLQSRIPEEAQPGQAFAFDISQRIGEIVTGGYTLYVVVAQRT